MMACLLVGCRGVGGPVARPEAPGAIDPAASGEVVAMVLPLYAVTARVANTYAHGDALSEGLAQDWRQALGACRELPARWPAADLSVVADDQRRQHLVLAGCQVLLGANASATELDGALSLLTLAVARPDASLAPVRSRGA
jgi:hypothetical protein